MELIKQIEQKRMIARKAKDLVCVNIIGLLIAEAQRKQRSLKEGVTDEMVISSAKKLIEANLLSADQMTDGEKKSNLIREIKFLRTLLPTLLSEEETDTLIEDILVSNSFNSIKDFGKVMGELKRIKNLNMKLASQIVKSKLS